MERQQVRAFGVSNPKGNRFLPSILAVALVMAAAGGLLGSGVTRAQSSPLLSTSSVTPADVVFYAEVSLDTTSSQFQQFDTLLGRMGVEESLVDLLDEAASDMGADVDLTGAEVALAILPSLLESTSEFSGQVVDDAMTGETPGAAELAAPDDTEGVVLVVRPTDIATFESALRESEGVPEDSDNYLGADILVYSDDDGGSSTYAFDGDYMFVGTTVSEIESFVDTARGREDALADLEQFGMASDLLPVDRVAFAFSNGPALQGVIEEAIAEPDANPLIDESIDTVTAYSGLTVSAGDDGLLFDSVSIPVDGSADATASGVAADLTGAARMPSDTAVFIEGFNLGQTTALNLLGALLAFGISSSSGLGSEDTASPTPVSIDEIYDQIDQMLGFNLKTDFFDQLTGPYAVGIWDIDAEVPAIALVSGTDDVFRIGNALGTLSLLIQAGGQGQLNVTSISVEGGSLDHVEFEDSGTTYEIDYGVVNDEFVVSLSGGAETVVNGPIESLADSMRYTTAMSYLPAEHYAVYYVDLAQLQAAGEDAAGSIIGDSGLLSELVATPIASDTTAQSIAAVSYVEDGYSFTSGIIVAP